MRWAHCSILELFARLLQRDFHQYYLPILNGVHPHGNGRSKGAIFPALSLEN